MCVAGIPRYLKTAHGPPRTGPCTRPTAGSTSRSTWTRLPQAEGRASNSVPSGKSICRSSLVSHVSNRFLFDNHQRSLGVFTRLNPADGKRRWWRKAERAFNATLFSGVFSVFCIITYSNLSKQLILTFLFTYSSVQSAEYFQSNSLNK